MGYELEFSSKKTNENLQKGWMIETGYNKKKDFKLRTRTRNLVIRFLFFTVKVLMYNYWILVKSLPSVVKKCC